MPFENDDDYSLRNAPRGGACVGCRRRKRKCDLDKPTCTNCKRMARFCEYRQADFSPLRLLRERVSAMEQRLRALTKQNTPSAALEESTTRPSRVVNIAPAPRYVMEWWLLDEIPPPIADCLISVFLKHASQFNFDEQVPSLVTRLYRYSPTHPTYPQPSLLTVIYLCASFYMSSPSHPIHNRGRLDWDFKEVEKRLLTKTRKGLMACLSNHDNIFDFLIGSTLLVKYYYVTMRNGEGHHEATGAMRIAAVCNLLSIRDGNTSPYPPSILGQPASPQDVRDRVNAFWGIFITDRSGSFVEGLPISVPDKRITTAFPCPVWSSSDPTQSDDSPPEVLSVASICDESTTVADVSRDSILSIKAKCATILIGVRDFITEAIQRGITNIESAPSDYSFRFRSGDRTLNRFLISMPRTPRTYLPESALPYDRVLADLAACNTSLSCCIIHYHGYFASSSDESRSKMLSAASVVVAVAQGLEKTPEIYWELGMMIGWGNACEVFHGQIRRILDTRGVGDTDEVDKLLDDMEFLARMAARYIKVYRYHNADVDMVQFFRESASGMVKKSRLGVRPSGSNHFGEPKRQHDIRPMEFVHWLGRSVHKERSPQPLM